MTAASPRVSVRGEAVLEVEPEVAHVTVAVSARDKDRQRTLTRLANRGDELRTFLSDYGEAVERVETGQLRVQPEIRERRAGEKIAGYSGTVRIHVTVNDFTTLGELVARLADREMTAIDGPRWALRRDSTAYRTARQQAAQTAKTRAAEYADAVGSHLTGLIELADVGLSGEPAPARASAPELASAAGAAAAESVPGFNLEPQLQVVRAAVEARFTIAHPEDLNGHPTDISGYHGGSDGSGSDLP